MKPQYINLFLALALTSCLQRPTVYTGSQFGVNAAGIKNTIPEKVSVGYERTEFAWLPRGGASSVKGTYDTEYRYPAGIALSELLITGKAATADPMSGIEDDDKNGIDSSLLVSTNTKTNLGVEILPSDGAGASFNFGFKRSVLALFPEQKKNDRDLMGNGELASTYTDVSLHADGMLGRLLNPKGIAKARQKSTTNNGSRVVQTIATGEAARYLAKAEQDALNKRISEDLGKTDEALTVNPKIVGTKIAEAPLPKISAPVDPPDIIGPIPAAKDP